MGESSPHHSLAAELGQAIRHLQAMRRKYTLVLAAVDRVLALMTDALEALRSSALPPVELSLPVALGASTQAPQRRRSTRFDKTAEESILDFIHRAGNPTTAQINAHWRAEGRCGAANNALVRLLRRGLIRRESDPQVRGSRYSATQSPDGPRGGADILPRS